MFNAWIRVVPWTWLPVVDSIIVLIRMTKAGRTQERKTMASDSGINGGKSAPRKGERKGNWERVERRNVPRGKKEAGAKTRMGNGRKGRKAMQKGNRGEE